MKKIILISVLTFVILLSQSSCKKDNNNDTNEPQNIYQSSLVNPTLEELQIFYEQGYDVINGSVVLRDIDELINMLALSNIITIKGALKIISNSTLISLEGLSNLTSVGGSLSIETNNVLSDLCGIRNILTNGSHGNVIIQYNLFNPTVIDIIAGNCSQ